MQRNIAKDLKICTTKETEVPIQSTRLTLDELFTTFMLDIPDLIKFREFYGISYETLSDGRLEVTDVLDRRHVEGYPLVYRHLIAEQLLQKDYRSIHWKVTTSADFCSILRFFELLMHPLCWVSPPLSTEYVYPSHIAKESYDASRFVTVCKILRYLDDGCVLRFADNPRKYSGITYWRSNDDEVHDWSILTDNRDSLIYDVLYNRESITEEKIRSIRPYDIASLRWRIKFIAKHRNRSRAIELLTMLQNEWELIKALRLGMEDMTRDEVNIFEEGLFHSFDDLLNKWKPSSVSSDIVERSESSRLDLFSSITAEAYQAHRAEAVEKELREACLGSAGKTIEVIRHNENMGYLSTRDLSSQELYNRLNNHFGVKYGPRNFSKYRSKCCSK